MSELITKTNTPKPPFLFTYWNPFDNEAPGLGQSFLNYVRDTSIAEYGARIVGSYIREANKNQAELLEDLSSRHISAMNDGFESTIEAIEDGFRFLDQRMGRIEQGIINANILLENINELLKLPDSEKQRQRHIELGLKFSNQSLKDSDLAIDSRDEFESALKLMPQDWFVLQQLGIIYLHSKHIQDLKKAKDYFLKAAKYARVENSDSAHIINWYFKKTLSPQNNQESDDSASDNELPLKDFILDCYLNAALCAYIETNFSEAASLALKAVEISSQNIKAIFLFSKYSARSGDIQNATSYVLTMLKNVPYMVDAISSERELNNIPEVIAAINYIKNDVSNRFKVIKDRINILRNNVPEKIFTSVEQYSEDISPSLFYRLLNKPLLNSKSRTKNKRGNKLDLAEYDVLFTEAAKLIVAHQQGSTSLIQRRLKLGYNIAGRIIDQLEDAHIVGPFDGSKSREVLVKNISELNHLLGLNDKWNILDSMTIGNLEIDWVKIDNVINSPSAEQPTSSNNVNLKTELENLLNKKNGQLKIEKERLNSINNFQLFRGKAKKEEQLKEQSKQIKIIETEIDAIKMRLKSS